MRQKSVKSSSVHQQGRKLSPAAAVFIFALLAVGAAPAQLKARQNRQPPPAKTKSQTAAAPLPQKQRRFFDKTNLLLFAGVAAVRALDFTSTQHFRSQGHNEILLTNSIVDNKPLFATIEVAGTALSIGISYLFYRTGHYKLERWVSIIHIGVGAFGDIHNYTLGPAQ